jgi:hypothetical protein
MEREFRAERASAGRASAKARGKTGGRPRTDVVKLKHAKVLYEHSGKTASEVCKMVGVGQRIFFTFLAQQREITHRSPSMQYARSSTGLGARPASRSRFTHICCATPQDTTWPTTGRIRERSNNTWDTATSRTPPATPSWHRIDSKTSGVIDPLVLNTMNSATRYDPVLPRGSTLCSHPMQ